jgi:hypothetical protein
MVQRREPKVFVREMSQPLESFVDRQITFADRSQQLF